MIQFHNWHWCWFSNSRLWPVMMHTAKIVGKMWLFLWMKRCCIVPHCAVLCCVVLRCDVMCCGVVWCDVLCCDIVMWCGDFWCGASRGGRKVYTVKTRWRKEVRRGQGYLIGLMNRQTGGDHEYQSIRGESASYVYGSFIHFSWEQAGGHT